MTLTASTANRDPGNKRVWRGSASPALDEFTFWSGNQKWATYSMAVSGSTIYFTLTGTNVYFGGRLIAKGTYNSGGTNDKVTLASIATDRLGSVANNGVNKFYPYGQERPSATANDKEKFTGYFRDAATGLDYAGQRYHNPGQGRFMTPDPFAGSAKLADPGSWNRYAYVGGDPVNRIDRRGLDFYSCYDEGLDSYNGCNWWGISSGFGWGVIYADLGESPMEAAYGFDPMAIAMQLTSLAPPTRDVVPASAYTYSAYLTAASALTNDSCASLFGGDASSLLHDVVVGSSSQVSLTYGSLPAGTNATTMPDVFNYTEFDGVRVNLGASHVVVTISGDPASQWMGVNTSDNQRAATLLHELGHVFNLLPGLGGSQLIQDGRDSTGNFIMAPDGSGRTASQYNTDLVKTQCGL